MHMMTLYNDASLSAETNTVTRSRLSCHCTQFFLYLVRYVRNSIYVSTCYTILLILTSIH